MNEVGQLTSKISSTANKCIMLNEHHLTGLFYKFYDHHSGSGQYIRQWIYNQSILQVLEDLNTLLVKKNLTTVILKGSHLLQDIYTDIGSRFMSDIDILIEKKDSKEFESTLIEFGCSPIFVKKFKASHFKSEWCKMEGDLAITIEVHTKLFYHTENEKWNLTSTKYSNIKKLTDDDLFIHLCGHLAFQHSFLKLYWLYDIYFLYQKNQSTLNWKYIKIRSTELKLYRSVQMCLWLTGQYFGIELEKEIVSEFELTKSVLWKKFLKLNFLTNPEKNKIIYYYIKHATKDHLLEALRYDLLWFYHYKVQNLLLR